MLAADAPRHGDVPSRSQLSAEEFRLFELIWKRTIASQMNDARGRRIAVVHPIGGQRGEFEKGAFRVEQPFDAIADEQKRLDADPEYQAAAKALEDAKRSVTTGEGARKIAELQRELTQAQHEDQKKDFDLRFVKSELEELRFKYDDALHHGESTDAIQKTIDDREKLRVERQKIYSDSQAHIEDIENQIKAGTLTPPPSRACGARA